jgi:hypothetical protein
MSSTESSGASAEATATTPATDAAFPTFGATRGSGLARGKRPAAGPAASTAASPDYTPTAIEVVNAPREYQNPFAPAETPAASVPAPKPFEPAPVVITPAPVTAPAAQNDEPAELNILEPAQQKTAPAQTWESEGFKPARSERPRREERAERPADEPVDVDSIPPQFLYVRPGHTYVPTPRNWGGAPRERGERTERSERPAHGSSQQRWRISSSTAASRSPAPSRPRATRTPCCPSSARRCSPTIRSSCATCPRSRTSRSSSSFSRSRARGSSGTSRRARWRSTTRPSIRAGCAARCRRGCVRPCCCSRRCCSGCGASRCPPTPRAARSGSANWIRTSRSSAASARRSIGPAS